MFHPVWVERHRVQEPPRRLPEVHKQLNFTFDHVSSLSCLTALLFTSSIAYLHLFRSSHLARRNLPPIIGIGNLPSLFDLETSCAHRLSPNGAFPQLGSASPDVFASLTCTSLTSARHSPRLIFAFSACVHVSKNPIFVSDPRQEFDNMVKLFSLNQSNLPCHRDTRCSYIAA